MIHPKAWAPALLVLGAACGDSSSELTDAAMLADGASDARTRDGAAPDASDAGPSCTRPLWTPSSELILRWPEPELEAPDETAATGIRLSLDAERYSESVEAAGAFAPLLTEDLSDLDGFGVNSEIYFMFNRAFDPVALPSGAGTTSPSAGLGIAVVSPGPPRLVPVLTGTSADGATLFLDPVAPLPEQARLVAFVTDRLASAAGGCLEASESFVERRASGESAVSTAISALVGLGVLQSADELIAFSAFGTQTVTADSAAVAADLRASAPGEVTLGACTDAETYRQCDFTLRTADYRDPDGVLRRAPAAPAEPRAYYQVPVRVWLPLGDPPHPTVLFGHGLGSGRSQGQRLAELAAPHGFATVSLPAVQHGEHPSVPPGAATSTAGTALRFLTLSGQPEGRGMAPLMLRDAFRQSTYDKLQVVARIGAGLDVDGDEVVDLDPERLAYLGVSLGGVMGPELAALTDQLGAHVWVVPGGRVSVLMRDSDLFGNLVRLAAPPSVTDDDIRRFFPILQTLLDRGDAASYGPHLLGARLEGAGAVPSLLAGVVLDDGTIPNSSSWALARAVGLPIAGPVLREVPGLAPANAAVPLAGNVASGGKTAGLLQFDVVREGGTVVPATHDNVGDSEVGAAAWFAFLDGHWQDGLARIVDPYAETGLAHADP